MHSKKDASGDRDQVCVHKACSQSVLLGEFVTMELSFTRAGAELKSHCLDTTMQNPPFHAGVFQMSRS